MIALVAVLSGGGGEADRRSAWRSWRRDRDWQELARALDVADLARLEVTRRGRSGRVVGLRAVGASGTRRDFEGFPIRRSLDIPENLFTFHVLTRPDGSRVVRFLGRGWGHGDIIVQVDARNICYGKCIIIWIGALGTETDSV